MDGTDTWVIVLAAFGGGLAGAVLQPAIAHLLELRRTGESIRKRRERKLRRMLENQIRRTRRLQGASITILERRRMGDPMDGLEISQLTSSEGGWLWQPNRIADAELRSLAQEYNRTSANFWSYCYEKDITREGVGERHVALDALQDSVEARMDELNWPEVDGSEDTT